MNKLLLAGLVAGAAVTPAFAQDTAQAPAEHPFDGFSITALGGIDVLTVQENKEADASRGLLFGGAIGYDREVGHVVLGAEAEISSSTVDEEFTGILTATDRLRFAAGVDYYGGIRIGARAGSKGLFYGKAGYVRSQLKWEYRGTSSFDETEKKDGFRIGFGYEVAGKHFFGRGEFRYQDLGEFTVIGVPSGYARTNTQLALAIGTRF